MVPVEAKQVSAQTHAGVWKSVHLMNGHVHKLHFRTGHF